MSVPLKSRLSYIWAKACGEDRLYSRVFNETDTYEVTRMNNIHIFFPGAASSHDIPLTYQSIASESYSTWMEARPVPGKSDRYFIDQHEHGGGRNMVYKGDNMLTREQALRMIAKQEKNWKKGGASQRKGQPFSRKLAIK